jgi:hypothetical protein
MFYRKVGGLHFVRFWRIRISFCLARPVSQLENYNDVSHDRLVTHERYLAG